MTIAVFFERRFLRYHAVSPGTCQNYGYLARNHIILYIGLLRISEVSRATFRLSCKFSPVVLSSERRSRSESTEFSNFGKKMTGQSILLWLIQARINSAIHSSNG